jgi:glycerol-3-phosphate dehydrogenase (NAD(P)+)
MKVAVLGAGAWGTALALSLCARHDTALWIWDKAQLDDVRMRRENVRFLPGFPIPDRIELTGDLDALLSAADLALVVVPTSALRTTFRAIARSRRPVPVVWASKGFEADGARLPHQVAEEELPPTVPRGVLSGPSFALEVAKGLPTAVTLAASDHPFAVETARQLHSPRLRIYSSEDMVGAEVGGAVKNVIAIAAGVADGLGFGHNARAALITRGLAEITRLGLRLGGRIETFMGLAGAGDLILTCTGDLSRNRRVGLMLAENRALPEILDEIGHVAEGVYTARAVLALAREHAIQMPITEAVCRLLFEGCAAAAVVEELLSREPKPEHTTRS